MNHIPRQGRRVAPQPEPRADKGKAIFAAFLGGILVLGLIVLAAVMLPFRGSSADELQGTWAIDGVTAYRFDGEGQGALVLPDTEYEFSYQISENQLIVDFVNPSARDFAYAYELQGDKLMLTGGKGEESVTYELVKQPDGQ